MRSRHETKQVPAGSAGDHVHTSDGNCLGAASLARLEYAPIFDVGRVRAGLGKERAWTGRSWMFSHVMVGVADLDRAMAFYEPVLAALGGG